MRLFPFFFFFVLSLQNPMYILLFHLNWTRCISSDRIGQHRSKGTARGWAIQGLRAIPELGIATTITSACTATRRAFCQLSYFQPDVWHTHHALAPAHKEKPQCLSCLYWTLEKGCLRKQVDPQEDEEREEKAGVWLTLQSPHCL